MIYLYLSQLYAQFAQAAGHHHSPRSIKLASAFALAVMLGLSPLLTSGVLYAQEVAPSAPLVSVNINNADAETLADGLTGVGLTRAREIVRYRENYGPFASIEELAEVKGVGNSTIEKNRALITLE